MKFTLYRADRLGMPENCIYPHKVEVSDKNTLLQAVSYDYVCAEYRGNYRNNDNFLGADCLPVDCDNDHSDDPEDWVYPSDVAAAFPGVAFAVHYSRNHMKVKNGKEARPKFHVLFPIGRLTDAAQYSDLKKLVNTLFPYFDTKALDAARFFFGTKAPQVDIFDGPMTLTTFLADDDFDANMDSGSYGSIIIPEGSRNATMSHYAGRILKRFGNTEEAHNHFTEVAACCQPPLEQAELDSIWRSAQRFYGKISAQDSYIPPEQYNQELKLKPTDYSDVGQATVLSREYEAKLRYTPSTDFLVYNGGFWEESKPKAQAVAQELTTRQLEEAETEIRKTTAEMMKNGACFPTHVKLSPPPGCKAECVIINAVECEPYLTADHRLMLEKADEVLVGVSILMKAAKVTKGYIGIENNKPDAIKLMTEKAAQYPGIEVVPLQVKYPQGGEKQLIDAVIGRQVPAPPAIPINVGAVVQNVGTAFAVYEAVQKNKPLFERIVTVTGKSVKNPSNFLTRMGTPMSQLIDAAGGLPEDTGKVIGGGPMMGKALVNTEVPICKGSSGVLIMNDKEAARAEAQPCIRCAKCVSVCPMGLEPFLLATLSAHKDWERVEKEDVMSCIECGSCQFTCPSHRYLLDYIRLGKGTVGGIIRARNAKK